MEYMIYTRDESGIISRTGSFVDTTVREIEMGEEIEERLTGWPERTIYWTSKAGCATGYALKRGQ